MKSAFGYILALFFLVILGVYWFHTTHRGVHAEPLSTASSCPYHNINSARCEPSLAPKKKEYVVLKNEIIEYIEKQKKEGKLTDAAVYFRDLENGPTMNINGQTDFIPASLLKLPLMMTYYKKAEDDPNLLQRKVKVEGDVSSLPQNIQPKQTAEVGKEYTIDQLIGLLISESDNTAWKVLLGDLRKNYSEEDFISTLSDLGIVDPRKRTDQQYITASTYAAIFRVLYNSSYLSIAMSDKALGLLAKSDFNDGLVAGLPTSTKVAHKFGEQKNGDSQELHDCGIVYYEPNPYIICVMTKGYDVSDLSGVIKDISQKVYQEVDSRNQE
jgi:beta-lactamase class A